MHRGGSPHPDGARLWRDRRQWTRGQDIRPWRLLAYVYAREQILNAELVRRGYAQVATFPPNVKDQELFLRFQREAWQAKRGLWGE
jgi:micrococcal nuclease